MRVALIHSYYESADSGENAYVDFLCDLLKGHTDVQRVFSRPPRQHLRAAANVMPGSVGSPLADIQRLRPDVVHVHNLVPGFSADWIRYCPVPIVATVHNYRYTCVAGTFVRDGAPCYECLRTPSMRSAVIGRCYRGSASQSALLVANLKRARGYADLLRQADVVLAPSMMTRDLLASSGIEGPRVRVLPHAVEVPEASDGGARSGFLYVGRLSVEKGLDDLLSWWPAHQALTVVGDGPQRSHLEQLARRQCLLVTFLGRLPRYDVAVQMARARASLFPSITPETFGLTYAEALAQGTPTVAREGTSVAEMVRRDGTGSVFSNRSDLLEALNAAPGASPSHLVGTFRRQYSAEAHRRALLAVYSELKNWQR